MLHQRWSPTPSSVTNTGGMIHWYNDTVSLTIILGLWIIWPLAGLFRDWVFTSSGHWEQWRGMILMMWGMAGHGASVMRMLTIWAPVTASLSLTSYGNGQHPDMDCIAPCHWWGQLSKRQFLMRSQIAIVRVTGSRRAMSILVSRLEITE